MFPLRLYLFALAGWAFDFYDLVLISFLKVPVGHDLHVGAAGQAWILGVSLGASGLGGLAAGWLADRRGKRDVLATTVLLYSLGSLIGGLAPNIGVFILGRTIVGLGVGGEWALGHGLLAEALPPDRRGRGAALLQSGEPLGVALAVIIGYLVAPRVGWRAVMIGSSATALLALVMRASVHIPNTPVKRVGLEALRRARVGGRLVKAWLLGVLKLGTYWTCYTWLPTFLSTSLRQDTGHSIAWILTAQSGQLVGMLTFGEVADRYGRRPAFCAYSLLTAAAIGSLAFGWRFLIVHPACFWATMLALGLGSGCTAGFGALLAELFPTEIRGAAMGATYNLARSAQLVAPVVVGWAAARGGLTGGLSVPMLLAVGTATWVWALPETRGIALPALATSAEADR